MKKFLVIIIILLLGFIGYQNTLTWIEKQKEEVRVSTQKEIINQCNQYIQSLTKK